ncbi:MAG: hypothetical protein ABFD90_03140 [Phycisphaerales bacterium]
MSPCHSNHNLPPSVELHIEELVLHGFAPGDRHPIQEAMRTELERLFTERGSPQVFSHGDERSHLDAGEFRLAADPRSETIGRQIAQSLFSSLTVNPE